MKINTCLGKVQTTGAHGITRGDGGSAIHHALTAVAFGWAILANHSRDSRNACLRAGKPANNEKKGYPGNF